MKTICLHEYIAVDQYWQRCVHCGDIKPMMDFNGLQICVRCVSALAWENDANVLLADVKFNFFE